MVRKKIAQSISKAKDGIEWRGNETTRIEAFSDSVFAFALTLLIVSLEVPKNFPQLKTVFGGFFAFGISFVLLFQIWYYQNLFFRRFGLQDIKTMVLNAALLFTVLFYVYPLKFLFSFVSTYQSAGITILPHEMPQLMIMYGFGFCIIFGLFALMYQNALKKASEIGLSITEVFETRTHIYQFYAFVAVGVFVTIVAQIVPNKLSGASGALYGLIGPAISILSSRRQKLYLKKFGKK
jgi:uncharacterized membrane protein